MIEFLSTTTFSISIALLALLAIRKFILKQAGATFSYQVWLLVPLIMVFSVLPDINLFAIEVDAITSSYIFNPLSPAVENLPYTNWVYATWLAGFCLLGCLHIAAHIRYSLRIKKDMQLHLWGDQQAQHSSEFYESSQASTSEPGLNVYKSSLITTPILMGVLKPSLVLPTNFESLYSPTQQKMVINHELHHLNRGDTYWNLLATIVLIVYWFQPLSWFAFFKFKQDQELSCDYAVLVNQSTEDKQRYAHAVINTVETQSVFASHLSFGSLGDKKMLTERLQLLSLGKPYRKAYPAITFVAATLFFATSLHAIDSTQKEAEDANSLSTPITRVAPVYPQAAVEGNVEGWVALKFGITKRGTVENILVIESSPEGVFDESAKNALSNWRYSPHDTDELTSTVKLAFNLSE